MLFRSQRELPPALQMPLQKSSGFNTALQIGQSLLGGAQTYMSLAAPAAGDIGGGIQSGNFNMSNAKGGVQGFGLPNLLN